VTFEVREEAVGIGQSDSVAKYGIGESIARAGEILEDDYGIAVIPDRFVDIISGIDSSKLGITGRVGEKVRSLVFGVDSTKEAGHAAGKKVRIYIVFILRERNRLLMHFFFP
jgi:hypothetical protein